MKRKAKSPWEVIARRVINTYGGYVDWEERFFECPECGEPVYECDWEANELMNEDKEFICPICETVIE